MQNKVFFAYSTVQNQTSLVWPCGEIFFRVFHHADFKIIMFENEVKVFLSPAQMEKLTLTNCKLNFLHYMMYGVCGFM
jgi:hypothetical protein